MERRWTTWDRSSSRCLCFLMRDRLADSLLETIRLCLRSSMLVSICCCCEWWMKAADPKSDLPYHRHCGGVRPRHRHGPPSPLASATATPLQPPPLSTNAPPTTRT
ncbi:hypothetical protein QJS10_CPB17g00490 [Acorus calamus]|uniref:Uncharacterized protein n=1 Tax=Acorus calamus TaxID=4465 RepID=A0AAV9CQZ0_ACOCL|nr:hypothetical protein QJS10_CPB17g00490 [Acorus calamus]